MLAAMVEGKADEPRAWVDRGIVARRGGPAGPRGGRLRTRRSSGCPKTLTSGDRGPRPASMHGRAPGGL